MFGEFLHFIDGKTEAQRGAASMTPKPLGSGSQGKQASGRGSQAGEKAVG